MPHSGQFISSEWSAHSACPSHLHCSGMHPGDDPDDPEGEEEPGGPPPRKSADDTDTEKGAIPAADVQVNSSGLHVGGKPQVRLGCYFNRL